MSYKLAIFDMDGTILDTLEDLESSLNFALTEAGCPARKREDVRRFLGNGMQRLIELAVPPDCPEEKKTKILERFKEHYKIHCADRTKPYDGITELLQDLRESGCRTAVVSNKGDFAVQELNQQYFAGLMDCAIGEKEGVRKKPAPDSVNEVLRELQIGQQDAVYIGDSEVDIETAKNAGMDCIIVSWGFRERDFLIAQGAELIVDSAEELEEQILGA